MTTENMQLSSTKTVDLRKTTHPLTPKSMDLSRLQTVPFDVFSHIIDAFDSETLKAVTVVSRAISHEARQRLFKICRLSVIPSRRWDGFFAELVRAEDAERALAHLEAGISFLSRRTRGIRALTVTVFYDFSETPFLIPRARVMLENLSNMLSGLSGLEYLRLEGVEGVVGQILPREPFAPNLREFCTSAAAEELGRRFWTAHRSLVAVRMTHLKSHIHPPQSPIPKLPLLRRVHLDHFRSSYILRGNPVTDLTLGVLNRGPQDLGALQAHLDDVTAEVHRLTITDSYPEPNGLASVLYHLPHLRYLKLNTGRKPLGSPSRDIFAPAIRAIGQLRELEVLEWWGALEFGKGLLDGDEFDACAALRRVEFRDHGDGSLSVYTRGGTGSPWSALIAPAPVAV